MSKLLYIFITLISIILIILFIRGFSEKQLDDVTPGISCSDNLLKKSDVLYVIPNFNNTNIAENKSWCKEILALNKTLALHGIYHTYNEFRKDRSQEYLDAGVTAFQSCFNKTPASFKPPQLAISAKNEILIENKMKLDGFWNQFFHKVYHCEDTGTFSNSVIDWI